MQGLCCARRYVQPSQARILLPKASHARRFASRPGSGGFKAGKPSGAPRSSKDKLPGFNATGSSTRSHRISREKATEELNSAEARPRNRLRIGPGKLILFSIAAYLGYKIYTWQTTPARSVVLNPKFFTPFILESREKVSSTSSILNLLSLPKGQNTVSVSEAWKTGVWSVQVMQPELQIARSYTPLPPIEGADPEYVRLFVRQEPQGEVSTFLHKISRGTIVHLRGPRVEYEIPDGVDEILFLAGGTGIAPALQVAYTLFRHRLKSSDQGPELRILWANRRREDSIDGLASSSSQQARTGLIPEVRKLAANWQGEPLNKPKATSEEITAPSHPSQTRLVEEVESLKAAFGGKVIVDYFIDEEGSFISESLLRSYLSGIDQTVNQDGTPRRKVVLVSGPEGFVNVFAGPKTWQGGREIQGPLGGMLKTINPQGWEIWKL